MGKSFSEVREVKKGEDFVEREELFRGKRK
jgi:hypothetical protein